MMSTAHMHHDVQAKLGCPARGLLNYELDDDGLKALPKGLGLACLTPLQGLARA